MDRKSSDKLLKPPSFKSSLLSAETRRILQCTSSATGNPRNKCALKPGHSLMDWIRLGNSGVDLSGTGGHLIAVSKEELAKHNTVNNAWMAIRGFVYNVTQYMEFHPGGVEELMRGVGSDATKLFDDTHAWVNYSQLLNKCRIGPLTSKVKLKSSMEKPFSLPSEDPFEKPLISLQHDDVLPRMDWIQKSDKIILYFYTKRFCNPGLLIRNQFGENRRFEIWILIGVYVHKFDFELEGRIKWPPNNARISTESGKIEVELKKHEDHISLWSDLGKFKMSKIFAESLEVERLEFKMFSNVKFNYDSFVMSLKNENMIYFLPVGHHLMIEDFVNGGIIKKCYTAVPKIYAERYINIDVDVKYTLNFLIKHYPSVNSFSQHLSNLVKETTLKLSFPKGDLKLSTLVTHRKFCFLAAGSGLTPFLSLIDHLLNRKTNRIEVIKLLYFNKTIRDIWCNEVISNISSMDSRLEFINILSCAEESWPGLKGRVCSELLLPIVSKSVENISYIAACGPSNFIKSVESILKELNFPDENIFIF